MSDIRSLWRLCRCCTRLVGREDGDQDTVAFDGMLELAADVTVGAPVVMAVGMAVGASPLAAYTE